jgi:hypothetical protein
MKKGEEMNFKDFGDKVEKNFASFGDVFEVELEKNELWDIYLDSFPEGTNDLYQTRSFHDCSCCRHFVRNIGGLVDIASDYTGVKTVWDDCDNLEYPYNKIAAKLAAYVRTKVIVSVFSTDQRSHGQKKSYAHIKGVENIVTFDHFYGKVGDQSFDRDFGSVIGTSKTKADVLKRTLENLKISAADEVADLITSKSIYRGEEFKRSVDEFRSMAEKYQKLNSNESRNLFVWKNYKSMVSTFKNSSIGSLVDDISSGVDLEDAVRMFESKVAPENYKRSKSLITPNMIKDALKTVDDLGYRESLERRLAKESDLSVNSVLFVDRETAVLMKDGLESMLMKETKVDAVNFDVKKLARLHISDFIDNIIPSASSMEVFVENAQQNNLMTLTAPVHEGTKNIFKWSNDIGWSYNGNITDSIKDKVKRAGGKTNAKCRVSLNWYNKDDLDIHVYEPNGTHIYYGNRLGKLDVDMNISNPVRDAVENVTWSTLDDGVYTVKVNNYTKRESTNVGFLIEFEINNQLTTFKYDKPVIGMVPVFEFTISKGNVTNVKTSKDVNQSGGISQEVWNIKTEQFVKVKTLLDSPNHWDDNKIGNKHWFFILKDCKTPEKMRGIYNEFLHDDLYQKHRKVFEVLGDKTKCEVEEDQLSGYGVSSTRDDELIVKVAGPKIKTSIYKLYFN